MTSGENELTQQGARDCWWGLRKKERKLSGILPKKQTAGEGRTDGPAAEH